MEHVLLVIQVLVTMALIVMVLIQRSDSDGFGLSGGSGGNLLSGRASANLMTRTTAILAAIFMANALLLGVVAARGHKTSIVETIEQQQGDVPSVPLPGGEAPADAAKKLDEKTGTTSEKLENKSESAPAVPVAEETPAKVEAKPHTATSVAKKPAKKSSEPADRDPNAE